MTATVHGERARAGLQLLKAGIQHAAQEALRAGVDAAYASAVSTPRFRDRRPPEEGTRGSIRHRIEGLQGFVEASGAARFLEYGTPPHVIVAHGKALRFTVEGQVLFRRWVKHPGTAARPFMHEARERGLQAAEFGVEVFVNAAIQRAH